jgi:hypothetical protein
MHNIDACVTKLFQSIFTLRLLHLFSFSPNFSDYYHICRAVTWNFDFLEIVIFYHILDFICFIYYLEYNDNAFEVMMRSTIMMLLM